MITIINLDIFLSHRSFISDVVVVTFVSSVREIDVNNFKHGKTWTRFYIDLVFLTINLSKVACYFQLMHTREYISCDQICIQYKKL